MIDGGGGKVQESDRGKEGIWVEGVDNMDMAKV
jgi:hypothetical protein